MFTTRSSTKKSQPCTYIKVSASKLREEYRQLEKYVHDVDNIKQQHIVSFDSTHMKIINKFERDITNSINYRKKEIEVILSDDHPRLIAIDDE
mgnify:CR=1 FL=1